LLSSQSLGPGKKIAERFSLLAPVKRHLQAKTLEAAQTKPEYGFQGL
jgi:hypothetical protein